MVQIFSVREPKTALLDFRTCVIGFSNIHYLFYSAYAKLPYNHIFHYHISSDIAPKLNSRLSIYIHHIMGHLSSGRARSPQAKVLSIFLNHHSINLEPLSMCLGPKLKPCASFSPFCGT